MFNCQVPIVDGYIKLYPYKITIFLLKSPMHRGSILVFAGQIPEFV